ncbi:MAG: hypothetical protein NTW93_05995 [Phycisphaerae bacterium]|nr:hypothetical protein [Phycisphaerae bacterium]
MNIIYTAHLRFRLKIRNIPFPLPKKIFKEAKEHYYDNLTDHYVAVHKIEFNNKIREFALSYDKKEDAIEIITIHPIKAYQKISRVNSGRWQKI